MPRQRLYEENLLIFLPFFIFACAAALLDIIVFKGKPSQTNSFNMLLLGLAIYFLGYFVFLRKEHKTNYFPYFYGMVWILIAFPIAELISFADLFYFSFFPSIFLYQPLRKLFFKRYGYSEEDYLKSQDTMPSENT